MKGLPFSIRIVTGPAGGLDYSTETADDVRASSLAVALVSVFRNRRARIAASERVLIEGELNSAQLLGEAKPARYRQGARGVEKKCRRCKRWLPAALEHFGRQKGSPDGMNRYCRECCRLMLGRTREAKWKRH